LRARAAADLKLYEAILWEPGQGCFLLERHLERLRGSAEQFGFAFDAANVERELAGFTAKFDRPRKLRLILARDGKLTLEAEEVKPSTPIRLALADTPVDSSDPFLRHKTSRREVYERALARHPEAGDVLLWNERGELTETCHGNLVLELGARRLTPPVSCGLLPGTFRAHLLEQGLLAEAALALDDLDRAERIFMINSVRRWCEAKLVR
jgi:para-aminobenzoate synthetase/4-amino-4-deoxychorismate lyase